MRDIKIDLDIHEQTNIIIIFIEILFCKFCCFLVAKRNANMYMLQVLMYLKLFTYKNLNLKMLNQVTRLFPFEFCWSAFNSTQYQML
jgi:hypothetical protein